MSSANRIFLSPPDVGPAERQAVDRAFDGGWIAPLGPEVDAFEEELGHRVQRGNVVSLSSGTAALHLALLVAGVQPGDTVIASDLTFAATANAIRYVGADPVFVDSDTATWNMDPDLLITALDQLEESGRPAATVIAVDLYGHVANMARIERICRERGVLLIEDAAEALGSTLDGRPAGSFGDIGVLSFNGNKIITTSGGGALVTDHAEWAERALYLATQARDDAPHYQHSTIGYNYRMSNLLAAVGRAQLSDLDRRVARRRAHFEAYRAALDGTIAGIAFMPEATGSVSNRWLTTLTLDSSTTGIDREAVRLHLASADIEARPVWKPMHRQPVFSEERVFGGDVSTDLFDRGLCLPSGSAMTDDDRDRVIEAVLVAHGH